MTILLREDVPFEKITLGTITAACLLLVAGWTLLEYLIWSVAVLPNQAPNLDLYALARSAVMAVLAFVFLASVATARSPYAQVQALSPREWACSLVAFFLLVLFVAIFHLSPTVFSTLSLEDGLVEWASALLPLLASLFLAWRGAGFLVWSREDGNGLWIGVALLACAAILFVLGMEEISWMQRVFGLATPASLSGNIQGELNFHNLATNQIGAVHKIGGFVVLILLPFLQATVPERLSLPKLADLVPSRAVALVSAPLAACNYNGWESLLIQMTSYLTIGVVLYFAFLAWKRRRYAEVAFCAALVVVIVGAQLAFIGLGERFVRIWDVTEYKELFIALGLAVWAVETAKRLRPLALGQASGQQRSIRA